MNASATPQEVAPQTALTVVQRARSALAVTPERDKALIAMAAKSAGIVTITNADGYKEVHAARMTLKNERVAINKSAKTARDDAVQFSKACIAEEARLVALIEPEEKRLQALQDAEDARVEAERKARVQAEADRLAAIRKRIDWIRAHVVELAGKPAAAIGEAEVMLESLPVTVELYAEFLDEAKQAKSDTLAKLTAMRAQAVANDAEAARLAAERKALDDQKSQQAREDQERAERIAREDAELAAARKADDDARAFLTAWDDAIREDAQRAEDARIAAARAETERQDTIAREQREREETAAREQREREETAAREATEAQERAAAAERKSEREAIERAADPWAAIVEARDLIRIDNTDPLPTEPDPDPRDSYEQELRAVARVLDAAIAARDRLAVLDKAVA